MPASFVYLKREEADDHRRGEHRDGQGQLQHDLVHCGATTDFAGIFPRSALLKTLAGGTFEAGIEGSLAFLVGSQQEIRENNAGNVF